MNYLTQLIDNQGQGGLPCEQVLGSSARVKQLAQIDAKYAKLFHLIAAHGIMKYVQENNFSDNEVKAFEMGLAVIPNFIHECYEEIEKSAQETTK